MSEQPVTVSALFRFHREVFLPDVERIVGSAEGRLRDEMHTLHDSLLVKLERLETEYEAIKAGLSRVEDRLDGVEQRLDGVEQRLERVEHRLDSVEAVQRDLAMAVQRLEERLSRVEKRLDELVVSQPGHALQAEVRELRVRLEVVETQVAALRKPQP